MFRQNSCIISWQLTMYLTGQAAQSVIENTQALHHSAMALQSQGEQQAKGTQNLLKTEHISVQSALLLSMSTSACSLEQMRSKDTHACMGLLTTNKH